MRIRRRLLGLLGWCSFVGAFLQWAAVAAGEPALSSSIGFPRARLRRTVGTMVKAGVIDPGDEPARFADKPKKLGAGRTVEVVEASRSCLCVDGDGDIVTVPVEVLSPCPGPPWHLPVGRLRALAALPGRDVGAPLPPGLSCRRVVAEGTSLVMVTADLAAGAFGRVFCSALFDQGRDGTSRWVELPEAARKVGAVVAMSGTFFTSRGADYGIPFGNVVTEGRIAHQRPERPRLKAARTFLCLTDGGRALLGETDAMPDEILARNRRDEFMPGLFERGERIRELIGGLGRLVVDGDVQAWRKHVGWQFTAGYYTGLARRAQALVGVDENRTRLFLLVQEASPFARRPLSLPELAVVINAMGAHDAAFADGGSSVDLFVKGRRVVRRRKDEPSSTAILLGGGGEGRP